jgi:DNA-directed RNA polymerase subunit RPC12/RpoP
MDLSRTEIEYNKVKNLRQYKGLTEQELRNLAFKRAVEGLVDINSQLINDDEKKLAKSLLKKYLDDFVPESTSDINILGNIIFLEVVTLRLQSELNKRHNEEKDIPLKMIELLHKNLSETMSLKESLGITKKTKDESENSVAKKIASIRSQFKVWSEQNQASRTICCPYCGQMVLLKMDCSHYDSQKHPFFKDRILGNTHLIDMYQKQRITKEDVAKVLEVSPDYIDWLLKKKFITT